MAMPYKNKKEENEYINQYKLYRKEYKYYKIARSIIKILSGKNKTILDIGSREIDLMSDFPFKRRVSVAISGPISNDKVDGFKMDFFDYNAAENFDIITCLQVVEHVENAKKFIEKILNSCKVAIISVPYKWDKGLDKSHIQDPIDENKMLAWSNIKPKFTFYVKDSTRWRMICIYGKIEINKYCLIALHLLLQKLYNVFCIKKYKDYSLLDMFFSIKNVQRNNSRHRVVSVCGLKMKFKF